MANSPLSSHALQEQGKQGLLHACSGDLVSYCASNQLLYSLSLHLCHASLEVVHHLLDHGVISDAVMLPISFELLVSL